MGGWPLRARSYTGGSGARLHQLALEVGTWAHGSRWRSGPSAALPSQRFRFLQICQWPLCSGVLQTPRRREEYQPLQSCFPKSVNPWPVMRLLCRRRGPQHLTSPAVWELRALQSLACTPQAVLHRPFQVECVACLPPRSPDQTRLRLISQRSLNLPRPPLSPGLSTFLTLTHFSKLPYFWLLNRALWVLWHPQTSMTFDFSENLLHLLAPLTIRIPSHPLQWMYFHGSCVLQQKLFNMDVPVFQGLEVGKVSPMLLPNHLPSPTASLPFPAKSVPPVSCQLAPRSSSTTPLVLGRWAQHLHQCLSLTPTSSSHWPQHPYKAPPTIWPLALWVPHLQGCHSLPSINDLMVLYWPHHLL